MAYDCKSHFKIISMSVPTENLLILVNFILKVYAPMWFTIKTQSLSIYGAKHLHRTFMLSRYLPDNLKAIIDPVIQWNGFYSHPENILLAMLADGRDTVKCLALRRILKTRGSITTSPHTVFLSLIKMPKISLTVLTGIK